MILFVKVYVAVFYEFKVQTMENLISVKLTSPGEEPRYGFLIMCCGYEHFQSLELCHSRE